MSDRVKREPPSRVFVRLSVDNECEEVDAGIQAYRETDTPMSVCDDGRYWAEYELKRTGKMRSGWDSPPISRLFIADKAAKRRGRKDKP